MNDLEGVELVKAHSRTALDALVEKPLLVAAPIGLLFVGAVLDLYVGSRHELLAIGLGVAKGVAWGVLVGRTQGLSKAARTVTILGFTVTLGLIEVSIFGGLVTALVLCAVPVLELGAGAPAFVRAQGQTWLAAQLGMSLAFGMLWLAVVSLGPLVLGPVFGALLAGVIAGPVVHWWLLQRADWCRPRLD
jgi:hypothetical protein